MKINRGNTKSNCGNACEINRRDAFKLGYAITQRRNPEPQVLTSQVQRRTYRSASSTPRSRARSPGT